MRRDWSEWTTQRRAGDEGMDLVLAEAKRRGVAVLAAYDVSGRFLRWSAVPWPR